MVVQHEGHPACKKVWVCVAMLMVMIDWSSACLIAPVLITISIVLAPIKSRTVSFRYQLIQVALENGC